MTSDLTSISTFGWYADTQEYNQDLLETVSTFGWYGLTIKDIVDKYPTVDIDLIIDQLLEIGLEIETIHDIEHLEISTLLGIGNLEITRMLGVELER